MNKNALKFDKSNLKIKFESIMKYPWPDEKDKILKMSVYEKLDI